MKPRSCIRRSGCELVLFVSCTLRNMVKGKCAFSDGNNSCRSHTSPGHPTADSGPNESSCMMSFVLPFLFTRPPLSDGSLAMGKSASPAANSVAAITCPKETHTQPWHQAVASAVRASALCGKTKLRERRTVEVLSLALLAVESKMNKIFPSPICSNQLLSLKDCRASWLVSII